jgi:lipid-A-disaccharide synthase
MFSPHKKIYIIAGEASGDLHGSNLIRALFIECPQLDVRCWGGDHMKRSGGHVVKHIKELAFMGFVEVLMNLRTIFRNISVCKKDIKTFNPDALILIDYPGFNLRIAEWANKQGIKVFYYISPQVWAWKQSRVHKIKRFVDHMFVILPFEEAFYAKFNYKVTYVGHPLLDALTNYRQSDDFVSMLKESSDKPIITLLPGSREQEVSVKLPLMIEAIKDFAHYRVVIAGAPSLNIEFYNQFTKNTLEVFFDHTYDLLMLSEAALVTSGTATLETALLGVPEVVCYKGSFLSYHIAKWLIKIRFISLVNLIMEREVVAELIQKECNPVRMKEELLKILKGKADRERIVSDYEELRLKLGKGGASRKVAQFLLKSMSNEG